MTVTFRIHSALAAAMLLGGSSVTAAQSLADTARQEAQRRQTVKAAPKTLTNKDLSPAPTPSEGVRPATGSDTAVSGDATAAPGDAGTKEARPDQAAEAKDAETAEAKGQKDAESSDDKGQKYWSDRMGQARENLRRDRTFAEALQSRINALTNEFVNGGGPQQRSAIEQQRQAALDELARLRKSIEDQNRAISDLEEEARRAGVPSGWLR